MKVSTAVWILVILKDVDLNLQVLIYLPTPDYNIENVTSNINVAHIKLSMLN